MDEAALPRSIPIVTGSIFSFLSMRFETASEIFPHLTGLIRSSMELGKKSGALLVAFGKRFAIREQTLALIENLFGAIYGLIRMLELRFQTRGWSARSASLRKRPWGW